MKRLKTILGLFRNKYLLALGAFAFVMLFFDENNIFVQLDREEQLRDMQAKKQFYENEIATTQKELSELQSNPDALEKYARENFYMKRSNEDVFIVENPADSLKNAAGAQ